MPAMKRAIYLGLYFLHSAVLPAQVNAYAKVTAVNNNVLSLSTINQVNGAFVAGQRVIVIQMQGASITTTANSQAYGVLNSLNSAGLYEIATIQSINSPVTSVTLTGALTNSYDPQGSLQIVSFPQLGVNAYTTVANISCLPWNGDVGGVVAFSVNGNLHLKHNISANGAGFRGGAMAGSNTGPCESTVWRTATGDTRYAAKGEGIYRPLASHRAGKAKAVNGGGGGIVHNGGGGGGANFTYGGQGYYGYNSKGCSAQNNAGGQGGLAISSNGSRVFMGGGGGGGHFSYLTGSSGANGGGVILIKCDTILINGTCTPVSITANGNVAADAFDGCGGGGAGGSVVLAVKAIRAVGACPLSIAANGGNGGNGKNDVHGGGGGGGQGAVYVSAPKPVSNVEAFTNIGLGGKPSNTPGSPQAGDGGGINGSGVFWGAAIQALPVELTHFSATQDLSGAVELFWTTATEKNAENFEVFYMAEGGDWELLGEVKAAGNSRSERHYHFNHPSPAKGVVNYYRLKQNDSDGRSAYSDIVYLFSERDQLKVDVYPNPVKNILTLHSEQDLFPEVFAVIDAFGNPVNVPRSNDGNNIRFNFSEVPAGIYIIRSERIALKVMVE